MVDRAVPGVPVPLHMLPVRVRVPRVGGASVTAQRVFEDPPVDRDPDRFVVLTWWQAIDVIERFEAAMTSPPPAVVENPWSGLG